MAIDEVGPMHLPLRPTWRCVVCAEYWPCKQARDALLDQTRGEGVGLLIHLAVQLMDAIEDLGDAATFERFLVWARGHDDTGAFPRLVSLEECRGTPPG